MKGFARPVLKMTIGNLMAIFIIGEYSNNNDQIILFIFQSADNHWKQECESII
jgi:hypothetical protein